MKLAQRIIIRYYVNKIRTLALISPRRAAEEAFRLFCTPYSKRKVHKAPAIFEKANKLSFALGQFTINGFRWQPREHANGKKILICHGFDSRSYKFDRYIDPLLNEGFEVLAFDAPAHGTSTGSTVNANQYRDMVLEINNRYGPIDGIMAHSFGCIAVALAIEQLENNTEKRLVLVAPATETTRAINTFLSYVPVSLRVREEFEKIIEELGGNPASWFSVSRVIQQIKTPTLWAHDQEDPVTPYEDMKHLVDKNLSHLQFEITRGLGHSNLYKDSRVAKRIVSFLSELKQKTA
ncbi:alpha/beta hydrolase [Segetibacter sp. 3557_3]|uniref:alpha/beta hydrolase n=1 Tax=Segetibacter sp. 3557_3 TaxID=2547429 RepID=UPI001058F256|nr:alpha/beta hydrolase [Segetibacter sp. 3557_3]TDH26533.1 alpha/beta hydrolase [Segetibacter sp. 3557_3]